MADRHRTDEELVRAIIAALRGGRAEPAQLTGLVGPAGQPLPGGFRNPLSALGSLIYGGPDGVARERLAGLAGQVLTMAVVDGELVPVWVNAAQNVITNGGDYVATAGGDFVVTGGTGG